jgi:hypothetical protein
VKESGRLGLPPFFFCGYFFGFNSPGEKSLKCVQPHESSGSRPASIEIIRNICVREDKFNSAFDLPTLHVETNSIAYFRDFHRSFSLPDGISVFAVFGSPVAESA